MRDHEQDINQGGDEAMTVADEGGNRAVAPTPQPAVDPVSDPRQGGVPGREDRARSFGRRALIRAGWSIPVIAAVDLASTKKAMALTSFSNTPPFSSNPFTNAGRLPYGR
jgi:hypothetical protein